MRKLPEPLWDARNYEVLAGVEFQLTLTFLVASQAAETYLQNGNDFSYCNCSNCICALPRVLQKLRVSSASIAGSVSVGYRGYECAP